MCTQIPSHNFVFAKVEDWFRLNNNRNSSGINNYLLASRQSIWVVSHGPRQGSRVALRSVCTVMHCARGGEGIHRPRHELVVMTPAGGRLVGTGSRFQSFAASIIIMIVTDIPGSSRGSLVPTHSPHTRMPTSARENNTHDRVEDAFVVAKTRKYTLRKDFHNLWFRFLS